MSKTMLYQIGSMISCGPFNLDYVIVDAESIAAYIGKGWYHTPEEAHEGAEAEAEAKAQEEQDRLDEEERVRVALLQQQIDDNQKVIDEKKKEQGPDFTPDDVTDGEQPDPEPAPAADAAKTKRPARRANTAAADDKGE